MKLIVLSLILSITALLAVFTKTPISLINEAESASDIRRQIVVSFLREVITPKVFEFRENAQELNAQIQSVCSTSDDIFSLEPMMSKAYKSYAFLEAVKFGSLADPVFARDIEINPLLGSFSGCFVDREIIKMAKNPTKFKLNVRRKSSKGLSAIEYLTTDVDLNHSCAAGNKVTKNWNKRPAQEKKSLRCSYLKLVGDDLDKQSDLLLSEWDPAQGDLVGDIQRNEMGNTSQDLLNQISDGLYFLERYVKSFKIARGIGLGTDCAGDICAQEFERPSLKLSMESVSANLDGFLSVFVGSFDHDINPKKGFYSLLSQLGRSDIAEDIFNNLKSAKASTDLVLEQNLSFKDIINEGFKNCKSGETSLMCDIYTPVQNGTLVFKTDFYSVLNLRKPDGIPVDND